MHPLWRHRIGPRYTVAKHGRTRTKPNGSMYLHQDCDTSYLTRNHQDICWNSDLPHLLPTFPRTHPVSCQRQPLNNPTHLSVVHRDVRKYESVPEYAASDNVEPNVLLNEEEADPALCNISYMHSPSPVLIDPHPYKMFAGTPVFPDTFCGSCAVLTHPQLHFF